MCPEKNSLNILLADDGSVHSQAAAALIASLPLIDSSSIYALMVFTPRQTDIVWALESALGRTRETLEASKKHTETELTLGYPAEKIMERAAEHHADLIVCGAKGLRATLGIALGGVAQQLAEYAEYPVLVVRAPYKPLERILLVVDGSECSQAAISYLGQFPLPDGVKATVLHVLPPVFEQSYVMQSWPLGMDIYVPNETEELRQAREQTTKQEQESGEDLLREAVARLAGAGIQAESLLRRGDAATEIIEAAKEGNVDLIVCGSRGLSTLRAFVLGSVSRKLLHYAPCSVLVVKCKHL
jgi:nucleotide-binding universal stress UspA family protein